MSHKRVISDHPNDTATGHLYEAKAELIALQKEAGRTPQGRCYSILITDLEKLIHVEAGYFPLRTTMADDGAKADDGEG
jgi:hypothetical protein